MQHTQENLIGCQECWNYSNDHTCWKTITIFHWSRNKNKKVKHEVFHATTLPISQSSERKKSKYRHGKMGTGCFYCKKCNFCLCLSNARMVVIFFIFHDFNIASLVKVRFMWFSWNKKMKVKMYFFFHLLGPSRSHLSTIKLRITIVTDVSNL